jgi:hypothetical protein
VAGSELSTGVIFPIYNDCLTESRFDFLAKLFYIMIIEILLYATGRVLNHERAAVDRGGICCLVFASGIYFAEIWHKDLNGSQPPGGG